MNSPARVTSSPRGRVLLGYQPCPSSPVVAVGSGVLVVDGVMVTLGLGLLLAWAHTPLPSNPRNANPRNTNPARALGPGLDRGLGLGLGLGPCPGLKNKPKLPGPRAWLSPRRATDVGALWSRPSMSL